MERYICIHGHFYQPPRENPWLEDIEVQDSAYPFHDWNQRITAECYEPNAASRILDGEGRIEHIVNNYSRISFNFGPTLLAWMERQAPEVYRAILKADEESRQRFSGHGSALAQCYNHMIMPLCNRRDKITQIRWGLADFEHRFGRKAEGMWLAETAVDLETLDLLAEQGVRYTILSPYQAGQVRKRGGRRWYDVTGGRIDPTTPYEQHLPSGRSIALFFYDGPISQAIAFERLLVRGEDLAHRLLGAFTDDRNWSQLVHIATDGESYGHHHPHGDMGLAYALHYIEYGGLARLTNYGEYLARHPRLPHVRIVENTAWSCVHGVGRWMSDCGCNSGRAGWHQQWRAPLRHALDWLRDAVAPLFAQRAGRWLRDPWAARDDYIQVILDRSPESVEAFLGRHARQPLADEAIQEVLKLLEMQRHAQLMYTSCGWFFDDISGIETVQVIQYAGRVVQLAEEISQQPFEAEFTQRLANAKSNLPEHADGREIYFKWVKPAMVDVGKVAAHYAASLLFEDYEDICRVYCYEVERLVDERLESGRAKMALGKCRVTSLITRDANVLGFASVHLGDHHLLGGVRAYVDDAQFETVKNDLRQAFQKADFAAIVRHVDAQFQHAQFSLATLFREEQRKILDVLLESTIERAEGTFRDQYERQTLLAAVLSEVGSKVPVAFRLTAQLVLNTDLQRAVREPEISPDEIRRLLDQAHTWQIEIDREGLSYQLRGRIEKAAERFRQAPDDLQRLQELTAVVEVANALPFEVNLFRAQNVVCELLRGASAASPPSEPTAVPDSRLVNLGRQLSIRI